MASQETWVLTVTPLRDCCAPILLWIGYLSQGKVCVTSFGQTWKITVGFWPGVRLLKVFCGCLHWCCMRVQSCPTLCDPMDCRPPGSSVHEIFQTRILEWVAISSFRVSSQLRDQTFISCISCLSRQILYHCTSLKNPCSVLVQVFCFQSTLHSIVFLDTIHPLKPSY